MEVFSQNIRVKRPIVLNFEVIPKVLCGFGLAAVDVL
jgi:hypothetical protein